ncbi:MAG: glycoside hydrolase family 5 protein [Prevotella sp.]
MRTKIFLIGFLILGMTAVCTAKSPKRGFVAVKGTNLIRPDGSRLYIQGTNLGNWLNPEGYMFGFTRTNSPWMINLMIREAAGPDFATEFWTEFKDNYITRADIDFIASTGANTVRLPFNYKLFTDEDYMGRTARQDGFARIDSVVNWCRANNLYLILDMHDCPGGQTGDNIDDGYGYPWIFESEKSQLLFCRIWREIAARYKNETAILGYELMNEPIAHYFENKDDLGRMLEPLYKRAVATIRQVDRNHVILLGGACWNSIFDMFGDWTFDDNIMYTCHRYGGDATKPAIQSFIDFRDKTGLPMYMGELGHNTMQWQSDFVKVMKENNISYTFWPYKKLDGQCMMAIKRPAEWDSVIVKFAEAERSTFQHIRDARPDQQKTRQLLRQFLDNCKFQNCKQQSDYIQSMALTE